MMDRCSSLTLAGSAQALLCSLQDPYGAPISPNASGRGARGHGRRDVSIAWLRKRRIEPRAVLHRRGPDARLEQVEAASTCCGGAAAEAEAKRRGWHLLPRSRRRQRTAASDSASPPPNPARISHPVQKIEVFSRI